MNIWDRADRMLSDTMNRVFGDPVEWHPMAYRKGGYTSSSSRGTAYPDTSRPIRGADQSADPFVAVLVWRPITVDPGTNINEQAGIVAADVMLEIDVRLFTNPATGLIELPVVGDRFKLTTQDGSPYTVELPREPLDDGTERVQLFCNAVSTQG